MFLGIILRVLTDLKFFVYNVYNSKPVSTPFAPDEWGVKSI
jgi:hypothetical protein